MTATLADRIGVGRHELISIVGAGGKTTLLHTLGRELAHAGNAVILTTTTRMAVDQVVEPACWSDHPADVAAVLAPGTPLFVMSQRGKEKATGLEPDTVNKLFEETRVDYVLVEADGARTLSIKAPADHEPVIPSRSTMVIVVVGADALGQRLCDVAHRPDRVAAITGMHEHDTLTPQFAAQVVADADGGLKDVPADARTVVAISKTKGEHAPGAAELAGILRSNPKISRVVTT